MTALDPAAADALLDGFCERDDWLGYGYLAERGELGRLVTDRRELPGVPAIRRRVDRAVVRAARDLGWTAEMLFHWTNSKMGRWYAEDSGDFRRRSTAARDYREARDSMRRSVRVFESEIPDSWAAARAA